MSICCPQCRSKRVRLKNQGRKVASSVGSVAGAAECSIKAMQTIRAIIPIQPSVGSLVLQGFVGAVAGGLIGAKLGEFIDDHILDNYQCLHCGYCFSEHRE